MMVRYFASALIVTGMLIAGVEAGEKKVDTVSVEHAWARASFPKSKSGAAYLTLVAVGKKPDRLIGLSSSIAERTEVHTHIVENDVMMMKKVAGVDVEPGSPTVFKPGGLHVMLIGLKAPLKVGENFELTLNFENSGSKTVTVPIQKMSSMEPADQGGDHSGHDHSKHNDSGS